MQVIYECLFQILGKKMKIYSLDIFLNLFYLSCFMKTLHYFWGSSKISNREKLVKLQERGKLFNAWGHNMGDSLIFFYASQVLRFWSWIEAEIVKKIF